MESNQRGSLTLVMLLLFGAIALVGGAYFLVAGSTEEKAARVSPEEAFESLRAQAERALGDERVVAKTVERNPNAFSCLFSEIGNCGVGGGAILLFESGEASAQSLSQIVKNAGLTPEGFGCEGFPSVACPLRVEASWQPVCGPNNCDKTTSFHLRVRVVLDDRNGTAKEWKRELLHSPQLKLSQGVICARNGGVWAATECLTPDQAAQRQVASSARGDGGRSEPVPFERPNDGDVAPAVAPDSPDQYICPQQIAVQGNYYPIQFITAGRGEVRVPAMNGCPGDDTFVFQCAPKNPASFESEGQWVQVEAIMLGADCQSSLGAGGEDYSRR